MVVDNNGLTLTRETLTQFQGSQNYWMNECVVCAPSHRITDNDNDCHLGHWFYTTAPLKRFWLAFFLAVGQVFHLCRRSIDHVTDRSHWMCVWVMNEVSVCLYLYHWLWRRRLSFHFISNQPHYSKSFGQNTCVWYGDEGQYWLSPWVCGVGGWGMEGWLVGW